MTREGEELCLFICAVGRTLIFASRRTASGHNKNSRTLSWLRYTFRILSKALYVVDNIQSSCY